MTNMYRLDDGCLRRLVGLVESTASRLVLSSTWRHDENLRLHLWRALADAALPTEGRFVGQTPRIGRPGVEGARGQEICAWLEDRPDIAVNAWVVLDDMDL